MRAEISAGHAMRAEIEAQVEARRQARLQHEEDAKSAAVEVQIEVEMGVCGLWRKLHGWIKADARGTQRQAK
jgi:hypothetical protein